MPSARTPILLAGALALASCGPVADDENYDTGGTGYTSDPYGNTAVNPPAENPTYGSAAYEETAPYTPTPAGAAPTAPDPAAPAQPIAATHTVVKGDTLWGLGKKYGVPPDAIRRANSMAPDDNNIRIGQTLDIPAP